MEVDDSIIPSTADEIDKASSSKENGGRSSRHSVCRTVLKDEVTIKTEEDPPNSDKAQSMIKSLKNIKDGRKRPKQRISKIADDSEDEEKEGSRDGLGENKKRSIASTVEKGKTHEEQDFHPFPRRSTKPQFRFRESNSDELLIGFDDNGECVFIKNEDGSPLDDRYEQQTKRQEAEPATKKLKKSPKVTLSAKASPFLQKSPAGSPLHTSRRSATSPSLHKTPTGSPARTTVKKTDKPESPKIHIVGDNGEATPAENTSNKPQATVSPAISASKKALPPQDEFYKLPFKYGWKRELVWRANMETSKDKADVYFISPAGKKLRTRNDIVQYLEGELTIENFCFAREPLGADSKFEIVRSAKPNNRLTLAPPAAVPVPAPMGKRISKPKGPKGASPPPQGWTPTRALKVNNAALLGRQSSAPHASRNLASSGSKNAKAKKAASTPDIPPSAHRSGSTAHREPCTMTCSRATGQIPQLKCVKCLCLFHHECVGLNRKNSEYRVIGDAKLGDSSKKRDYTCEACKPTSIGPATSTTTTGMSKTLTRSPALIQVPAPSIPSPVQIRPMAVAKSHTPVKQAIAVQLASQQRPSVSAHPQKIRLPQSIVVFKGKKHIAVSRPLSVPNVTAKEIANDIRHFNDTSKNRKKSLMSMSLDDAPKPLPSGFTDVQKMFCYNFFSNIASAYDVLTSIFKYLKIHERSRAALVCKLWNLASKDTSLWQVVRMKNSKVCNWQGFANALRRGETKHLDLRKMLIAGGRGDEMWLDFCKHIGTVQSLEVIDLCRCSARVVESLFQSNRNLRALNALAINGDTINLESISLLQNLEELRLRTCEPCNLTGSLEPLQKLTNLKHLSLTAIRGLGTKCLEVLGELSELRSLELGECGDFDSTFAMAVLPKLSNLQRLRLENGQEVNCCTLEILEAAARLEQLTQLELVNFDIKPGFDDKLQQCTNIRKLLIIPTYISQSATTNHIMLKAVQQVADTVQVLTWGVTVELLRVTALYVDQCEEAKKKEQGDFNECIPVLKPVPGAPPRNLDDIDGDAESASTSKLDDADVPQIEILPLYKVEIILQNNMPHTKYTIVKLPYHATCKQQLVE